jgi:cob(I)alamin adenosyltransferase
MPEHQNRLHLYTGDGKGKTCAAVGMAIRAIGAGMKVAFLQFDKGYDGGEDLYNERKVLRGLDALYLFASGLSRFAEGGGFRTGVSNEDVIEAKVGIEKANQLITDGRYDMVILDEAITGANYGLFTKEDIVNIVKAWQDAGRPCELVLTGRGAWDELIDAADLVSEVNKIKHYYDSGHPAKRGVEY